MRAGPQSWLKQPQTGLSTRPGEGARNRRVHLPISMVSPAIPFPPFSTCQGTYEAQRVVTFIPPDGEFELMK